MYRSIYNPLSSRWSVLVLALLGWCCLTGFTFNIGTFFKDNDAGPVCSNHTIFATSIKYNGNLGGTSGADATCQSRAVAAGLSGTWKAILSTSSLDAKDHICVGGSVKNRNSTQIASGALELWGGSISAATGYDEFGNTIPGGGERWVWTGTYADGTNSAMNCNNWTSALSGTPGTPGVTDQTNSGWVDAGIGAGCSALFRLYCIDGQ
jgi:hypothetical protein